MVFRGAELEYDNFELIRGQSHMIKVIERLSHEVVIIDTREVMPDNVARRIMGAHGQGKMQHADFASHRLQCIAVAFHAPIEMNKIYLPAIDTKTATIATISSMWIARRKTCTY